MIEEGLEPTDWVVTGGLVQVRPRMKVEADKVAMPTLVGRSGTGDAPPPAPLVPGASVMPGASVVPSSPGAAPAEKAKRTEGRRP